MYHKKNRYLKKYLFMSATIKIPIDKINSSFIQDIQEKYGDAELEITINQKPDFQPMKEGEFWQLIELLDWNQDNNQAIIAPVIEILSSLPVGQIYSFQEILAQKLYQLDQEKFAKHIGKYAYQEGEYFSADHFLHVRACIVANGKEAYQEILKNPKEMFKDLTFEPLLTIASKAYEKKTGNQFIYVPSRSYETYSNQEGWQ